MPLHWVWGHAYVYFCKYEHVASTLDVMTSVKRVNRRMNPKTASKIYFCIVVTGVENN
jgi:hypothetical protein